MRLGWSAFVARGMLSPRTPARAIAHEIPPSVTVLAFVKPEAQRLRVRPARAARGDARRRLSAARARLSRHRARRRRYCRTRRASGSPATSHSTRATLELDDAHDRRQRASRFRRIDRSRRTSSALAHLRRRAARCRDVDLYVEAGDARRLDRVSDRVGQSRFSIDPALARLGVRTTTVLRFLPPNGAERAFEYIGDPGLVHLDPRWHQAALRFVSLGFEHILDGIDHLLFVFCLVIPFRRLRPLIAIVTAFTVAHSITLARSALGFAPDALWFPPLIEVLIALVDRVHGAREHRRARSWNDDGWSRSVSDSCTASASRSRCASRCSSPVRISRRRSFAFNVGVELGQIARAALAMPVLTLLFQARRRRAHGDDHPLGVRGAHGVALDARSRRCAAQYHVAMPAFDAALAASADARPDAAIDRGRAAAGCAASSGSTAGRRARDRAGEASGERRGDMTGRYLRPWR